MYILSETSMKIYEGDIIGIVSAGRPNAGLTSAIKCLAGLEVLSSGKISYEK